MSRRQKAKTEDKIESEGGHVEEEVPESPPGTRRTRSGRKVRTPAALLEAEAPVRTPTRRTRRTVLQELPALEDKNTAEEPRIAESLAEEKLSLSADPKPEEPGTQTDTADVNGSGDIHPSAPGDTAAPDPDPAPDPETVPKKKTRLDPSEKTIPMVPLGKPKSGRVWKNRNKQRFSALVRDKPLCSSWEKKMEAKREKQLVKQYSLQLKEEKARQKEEKRKRREENLKRRAENERKAEIVQVIKSTAKIKRMKKKQLRKIEKRDTLALLQKTQKQNVKAKGQKNSKVDQDLT